MPTDCSAAFTPRKAHEDHLFTLRVMLHARRAIGVPELMYTQQVRAGSLTNSKKDVRYVVERINAYREARDCLREHSQDTAAYDWWSLRSILYILYTDRSLLPRLLATGTGLRFLVSQAPTLMRHGARKVGRRLGPGRV